VIQSVLLMSVVRFAAPFVGVCAVLTCIPVCFVAMACVHLLPPRTLKPMFADSRDYDLACHDKAEMDAWMKVRPACIFVWVARVLGVMSVFGGWW
jgi:hypothetical protein